MRSLAAALLAAMGGFIVLVIEIIGARYLAKDFGGSFYIWVSQIGVVMLALALGYYVGGALADRHGRLTTLALLLVAAGAFTFAVPRLAPPVIEAIITRHSEEQAIPLIWRKLDPAMGSLCVFLFPCLVLAMLPPFLIRWLTPELARVGRSSGAVISAGTMGSIAGVFVAGYVLIDIMSLSGIFRVMGALTALVGLLCVALDVWLGAAPLSQQSTSSPS